MTLKLLSLFLFIASFFTAHTLDERSAIQQRAQRVVNATINANFDELLDLTYPKVVKMMGDRKKMIEQLKKEFAEMKEQGYQFLPTAINAPSDVFPIGKQRFAILTYNQRMVVPGGRMHQACLLLGVQDHPADPWTFVDATNMDESKLKLVFPAAFTKLKLKLPPHPGKPIFEKSSEG